VRKKIEMKIKTIIFNFVIIGLIGIGETASAVTFSCPTLDASKFQRAADNQQQSSYNYVPSLHELTLNTIYSQPVAPSLTLNWSGYQTAIGVTSDNPDDPKSKNYRLISVTLKNATLKRGNYPLCNYTWNFSGLIFLGDKSYFESSITTTDVHNCTLSGTTFTCS